MTVKCCAKIKNFFLLHEFDNLHEMMKIASVGQQDSYNKKKKNVVFAMSFEWDIKHGKIMQMITQRNAPKMFTYHCDIQIVS